jgi:hypothetical protein
MCMAISNFTMVAQYDVPLSPHQALPKFECCMRTNVHVPECKIENWNGEAIKIECIACVTTLPLLA